MFFVFPSCNKETGIEGQWVLEDLFVDDFMLLKPIDAHDRILEEKAKFLKKMKGNLVFKFESDGDFSEKNMSLEKSVEKKGVYEFSKDQKYVTIKGFEDNSTRNFLIVKAENDTLMLRPVLSIGDEINYSDFVFIRK